MFLGWHVIPCPLCKYMMLKSKQGLWGPSKEAWGLTRRITAVEAGDTEHED